MPPPQNQPKQKRANHCPHSIFNESFASTVETFSRETMPLLLHGSGDVLPSDVNPATAHLVAALTTQYISNLVDAALDSQQILCDHNRNAEFLLPPPVFARNRLPPKPAPLPTVAPHGDGRSSAAPNRKRRAGDEFWDEPLPEPKIRNKSTSSNNGSTSSSRRQVGQATAPSPGEWVGVAGVDFFETSRCREAYVRGPSAALTTQSFVFPICHDVYLYGRVTEMQAAKRSLLQPVLLDPVVQEMVRTEGSKPKKKKKKKDTKPTENTSDPEDEDEEQDNDEAEEDEKDGPVWPGLDGIIPLIRSMNDPTFSGEADGDFQF